MHHLGFILMLVGVLLISCGKREHSSMPSPPPPPGANNEAPAQNSTVESLENHSAICIRVVKRLGHWEEVSPWQCFPKTHGTIKQLQ